MSKSDIRHLQIADYLIAQIKKGTYRIGDKLPSEHELCDKFQANHHIVRTAVARLINMGWITAHQGKGAFVISRPEVFPYQLSARTGFSENLKEKAVPHRGQLLHHDRRHPTQQECRYLNLETHEFIYDLRIKRFINETPVSLSKTIICEKDIPNLENYLTNFKSLYKILSDHYRISPVRTKSIVQAILPNLEDVLMLQLPENVPLVQIRSFANHPNGHPFEYTLSKMRSDTCHYVIDF
ncbi:MAG: GntR family transcriptional regulator [Sporolactobacillus sp.]|uniref:GntR family transcriptional regulator n=1 Tax=Sporolactobacillus sp. STSJ-5 TaxID=2965076 RepID=UPI0021056803|nr:GntR family transcriptional regulator [Sporolactobacillus sp. STSJ-5]MCQ2011283.1 GntR family transcriptional regulator [Sporolactobacillus sp. STSJ-5]